MPATAQPAAPSKQDEIDRYREFVAAQPPGSYLAMILDGSEIQIERMIRNDFAYQYSFAELRKAHAEAYDDLQRTKEQVKGCLKARDDAQRAAIRAENAEANADRRTKELVRQAREILAIYE